MAKSGKLSKQPSPYPGIPFHFLRFLQFGSSLCVLIVTIYFTWNLTHDNYGVPWTFIILLLASVLNIIAILITTLLHCCRSLHVPLNMVFNLALVAIWTAGFGLLAWATSGTLSASCNNENWGNLMGSMICRVYKLLFSTSVIALISSVLCLILDLVVRREQNARGRYIQAPDIKLDNFDNRNGGRRDSGGPFEVPRGYGGHYDDATRSSAGFERGFGNEHNSSYDGQETGVIPISSRFESGYGNDHHTR